MVGMVKNSLRRNWENFGSYSMASIPYWKSSGDLYFHSSDGSRAQGA